MPAVRGPLLIQCLDHDEPADIDTRLPAGAGTESYRTPKKGD